MTHILLKQIEDISKDKNENKENSSIAKYLFKHFKEIDKISITKIARECKISPTKVTRFAEKLG
ncbi:hypothetical protein [Mesoplasma melaleucae]|uniref:hypothetical protein n=1 Tax=Mesoplasma melaleucae TaxID=81459 RepID=UPI000691394E|nr:hypothetical protein [Mesoplasma melaleucae]